MNQQRAAALIRWANPQQHIRASSTTRAAWANPDLRSKMSASIKAAWTIPKTRSRWISSRRTLLLPPMTPAQRKLYDKLRRIVSRQEALAEALRIPGESK